MLRFPRIILLLVLTGLGGAVFYFYRQDQELRSLTLQRVVESPAVGAVIYPSSYSSPSQSAQGRGIIAISTGKVAEFDFKAGNGEVLGRAYGLRIATRSGRDESRFLELIVQITEKSSGENIIPWVIAKARSLRGLAAGEDVLSVEQIKDLFPRGSKWGFIPLIDPSDSKIPAKLSWVGLRNYGGYNGALDEALKAELLNGYASPIIGLDIFRFEGL